MWHVMTLVNIVHPPPLMNHLLINPINKVIYGCSPHYCGAEMQMAAEAESLLLSFLFVLSLEKNLSNQEVLWHKDTKNLLIAYI